MLEKYPILRDDYELHLTSSDCTLFYVQKEEGLPKNRMGMREYNQWNLPRLAAEYLIRCDGQTKHADICRSLEVPFTIVMDRIANSLVKETGVIIIGGEPSLSQPSLFLTGSFDSLAPLHISVEITDTCNFLCDHCYVSASPSKLGKRDHDPMIHLLDDMRDGGVKVVEITGGECTTHPQFKEILAHASHNFHLVAVVSNGFLLGKREDLADYVASFDNVCVQISIDGKRDFHDKFRKKVGSFDAACTAILPLKNHGAIVRIAMSVTEENVEQVEDVFLLAKELGVDAFAAAPVTNFGRGAKFTMCPDTDRNLQQAISEALAPYADDSLFDANRLTLELMQKTKQINCGAGWRSFGLNGATGELRSCLYLADSKKFGSVDKKGYAEIFRDRQMQMFKDAPSPSACLETCRSCVYIDQCNGCFAKAFEVSESEYPECPWRKKWFPGVTMSLSGSSDPRSDFLQIQLKDGRSTASNSDDIGGFRSPIAHP